MKNRTPLIISIVIHATLIVLSYVNMDLFSSRKIKDSGFAVFDFVELSDKTRAPILSNTEGRLSKTESQMDEKEVTHQESQPLESAKKEEKPDKDEKADKGRSDKKDEKAVSLKKKKEKSKPKKANKKKASKTSDKALVNLRKNKSNSKGKKVDLKAKKKAHDSLLAAAIANSDDNENTGMKAEEVGETISATQIDLVRQTLRKCWHFPAGLRNAEDLVVDIKMELDKDGNIKKAEIMDKARMNRDPEFRIAAENAHRAVLDPNCNPLPLPKDKYEEWKDLELSFNPRDMMN